MRNTQVLFQKAVSRWNSQLLRHDAPAAPSSEWKSVAVLSGPLRHARLMQSRLGPSSKGVGSRRRRSGESSASSAQAKRASGPIDGLVKENPGSARPNLRGTAGSGKPSLICIPPHDPDKAHQLPTVPGAVGFGRSWADARPKNLRIATALERLRLTGGRKFREESAEGWDE
ncbi:hypothetical protein P154DRAFT_576261 [Amniculicola lignicola CBS 123094]|uniref:Uncharacterized protein n=1 Tax=Amniculicola lignicola CBS 123094 TaxID=1392246 RepID=A0A6A5WH34_9PLEO|nr:hypothetical protein P154DRAFT_576261 [Amniculicola lignicola CBS 123094]